jgi:hypothetical protein
VAVSGSFWRTWENEAICHAPAGQRPPIKGLAPCLRTRASLGPLKPNPIKVVITCVNRIVKNNSASSQEQV